MDREACGGYRGRGRGRGRGRRGRGGGDRGGSAAGEGAGRRGGRGPPWHGATQVWSEQQQQPPPRPRQPQSQPQPQPQPHVGVGGGGPPGSQWVGPTSEGSSWASKVGGAGASTTGGKVVRGQGDSKWVEVGRTAPSIPSQPRPQPQPQPPSPPPSVAGIRSGSLLFSAFLFFSFFCVLIKLGKPSWKIMVLKVVSL